MVDKCVYLIDYMKQRQREKRGWSFNILFRIFYNLLLSPASQVCSQGWGLNLYEAFMERSRLKGQKRLITTLKDYDSLLQEKLHGNCVF